MVLASPGPLLTAPLSSSPRRPLTGPTPSKLDPRMKRRTTPPKPHLPPQTRTRHRLSHRPHAPMLMGGNTPTTRSPPHRSRPTGNPPNQQPATVCEDARVGRGTTSRRTPTRATPSRRPPPTTQHEPPPRTSTSHPPSTRRKSTAHTSTHDPHCRKPAHSRRRASTGGRPRHTATVRGRPPGDAHRHPRMRPSSGRPPVETRTANYAPARGRGPAPPHATSPRQQQQDAGRANVLSSATGPSAARCSKDVTTHQHRPGARPGRPCPVPARSGQPLSGRSPHGTVRPRGQHLTVPISTNDLHC